MSSVGYRHLFLLRVHLGAKTLGSKARVGLAFRDTSKPTSASKVAASPHTIGFSSPRVLTIERFFFFSLTLNRSIIALGKILYITAMTFCRLQNSPDTIHLVWIKGRKPAHSFSLLPLTGNPGRPACVNDRFFPYHFIESLSYFCVSQTSILVPSALLQKIKSLDGNKRKRKRKKNLQMHHVWISVFITSLFCKALYQGSNNPLPNGQSSCFRCAHHSLGICIFRKAALCTHLYH